MPIRINSRPASTQSALRTSERHRLGIDKSLEKLSSGRRINRAADDAAGLAISQKMGEALKALEQGMDNAYDGMSLIQVADGGLDQVSDNLGRMRELAMTAANGTLSADQRGAVQAEFDVLKQEVDRISQSTEFNGQALLDGSAGDVEIAVAGADGAGSSSINIDLGTNLDSASLGLATTRVDGADGSAARAALQDVESAMQQMSAIRADLGASSNQLMSSSRSMGVTMENTAAAQSRIMDTDYAKETAELTRQQILAQGATAMQIQSRGLAATALNLLK